MAPPTVENVEKAESAKRPLLAIEDLKTEFPRCDSLIAAVQRNLRKRAEPDRSLDGFWLVTKERRFEEIRDGQLLDLNDEDRFLFDRWRCVVKVAGVLTIDKREGDRIEWDDNDIWILIKEGDSITWEGNK